MPAIVQGLEAGRLAGSKNPFAIIAQEAYSAIEKRRQEKIALEEAERERQAKINEERFKFEKEKNIKRMELDAKAELENYRFLNSLNKLAKEQEYKEAAESSKAKQRQEETVNVFKALNVKFNNDGSVNLDELTKRIPEGVTFDIPGIGLKVKGITKKTEAETQDILNAFQSVGLIGKDEAAITPDKLSGRLPEGASYTFGGELKGLTVKGKKAAKAITEGKSDEISPTEYSAYQKALSAQEEELSWMEKFFGSPAKKDIKAKKEALRKAFLSQIPNDTTVASSVKTKSKYAIGDIVHMGKKRFKITGFDTDGTPLGDEVK